VMNEANYIEASSAFVDFIADHQTIKEFQNWNHLPAMIIYTSAVFQSHWWRCGRHAFYRKTWRIQTSLSIGRCKPQLWQWTDLKKSRISNQPYWGANLYRETLFSYEGRFEKEDGEILANRVKGNEFEIVSGLKKNSNRFAQKNIC
jgi:hypothetical protein